MSEGADTGGFVAVAAVAEIPENGSRAVAVAGRSILLCRTDGKVFAVENQCSHAASPLEGGRVRPCYVICPLHGVRYDLKDGTPRGELTRVPIRTYPVRLEGDCVLVALES